LSGGRSSLDAITVDQVSKSYRFGKKKKEPKNEASIWLPRRAKAKAKTKPPREVWALREVSFAVPEGQILGVVGPNGAGKSTLLKLLARVTPPTTGRALVRGRVVSLLELGAGFQPDLSGRENVVLNAAFHGVERKRVLSRMDEIVEFAGLEQAIDRPVKGYSSGMYLRLAFSVAINLEPDILLADEVLAVGDLEFQERCLRRVQQAGREDGLTVLFVSHDMAAVRRLCDRTLWLDHGEIAADGGTDEVIAAYEAAAMARFTHTGSELPGRHRSDFGELLGGRLLSADGMAIGAARVSDDLLVESTFRIDIPGVSVRNGIVVQSEGVVAFRSVAPAETKIDEAGIYRARVRIPAHLLNDTTYTVKLGIQVRPPDDQVVGMARDNALSFRVWDSDEANSARGDYTDALVGVLRPRLDWTVASDREAQATRRR
jgi:lipopolysaccharide transport system ATP-binding protein